MMADKELYCKVCNISFNYPAGLVRHYKSKRHGLLAILHKGRDPTTAEDNEIGNIAEDFSDSVNLEEDICDAVGVDDEDAANHDAQTNGEDMVNGTDDSSNPEDDVDDDNSSIASSEMSIISDTMGEFYPFDSKESALLYILINNPIPVAERILKFFFFFVRHIDPFLPSLAQIKKIELPGYIPPMQYFTPEGIPFYINLPSTIIKGCLSSVDIAKELCRYPVTGDDGLCSEMYEAERWKSDSRFWTPMTTLQDGSRVFIGDVVQIDKLCYGKIRKIMIEKSTDTLLFQVQCITVLSTSKHYLWHSETKDYPASQVTRVYDHKCLPFKKSCTMSFGPSDTAPLPITDEAWNDLIRPNQWKEASKGRPVVVVPLTLFCDDVSGNISKKWNKFDVWALLLAGLPKQKNSQLENIHYICASNRVSCLELAKPMVDDLLKLEDGVIMYDALLEEDVLVVAPILCFLADNPRASELASHCGTSARMFCRICKVDGHKNPGNVSCKRSRHQVQQQVSAIRSAPNEATKKQLRTLYGVKEIPNPLLRLHVDICQSTPVECLHTLLLGSFKYLFRDLMDQITSEQKNAISARIDAFPSSGIEMKLSTSACRYYQSFNGKDFKALAQIAVFVLWEEMSDELQSVWLSLSKIFRLTYCKPFKLEDFTSINFICIEFIDNVKKYKPTLLRKPKLHMLLHLADNMKDFGPTACFNTERCEAFNKLVKTCHVHSNKQAPSRDIADKFRKLEHLRNICTSGRCGDGILRLLETPRVSTFLHGTATAALTGHKKLYQPGKLRKDRMSTCMLKDLDIAQFSEHSGATSISELQTQEEFSWCSEVPLTTEVKVYGAVVAHNGTLIQFEDNVAFNSKASPMIQYGQLKSCVETARNGTALCVLQVYYLEEAADGEPVLNRQECPLLIKSTELITVPSQNILSPVSMVHECSHSCHLKRKRKRRHIERQSVNINTLILQHDFKDNNKFALNIYAMHTI